MSPGTIQRCRTRVNVLSRLARILQRRNEWRIQCFFWGFNTKTTAKQAMTSVYWNNQSVGACITSFKTCSEIPRSWEFRCHCFARKVNHFSENGPLCKYLTSSDVFELSRYLLNSRISQTEGISSLHFRSFIRPVSLKMLRQSSLSQLFGSPADQLKYVSAAPVTLETNVPSVAASVPSINIYLGELSATTSRYIYFNSCIAKA